MGWVDRWRTVGTDRYALDCEIGRGAMLCPQRNRARQDSPDRAIEILGPEPVHTPTSCRQATFGGDHGIVRSS
jgi:hypothetical protein